MTRRFAFLTGMQRSGTTLLDKLLSSHPDILLLSQPVPFVFLEAKRRFLRERGFEPAPYPLSDLFLEDRYEPLDLAHFLDGETIPRQRLVDLFEEMEDYSGQYTRVSRERLLDLPSACSSGTFADRMKALYEFLAGPRNATILGGKETLCEEFLPYLLDRGFHGIIIVRDARDVLASLNSGKGTEFAGTPKPTLFNLRNWRKSVAFSLHLLDHPRFTMVRYEDLVATPPDQLARLAERLGTTRFEDELFESGIRDQHGWPWEGNSSHERTRGISSASVGRYRERLPDEVVLFAEAVCHPELRFLGYPVSVELEEAEGIIRSFEDPYELERGELAHYLEPARAEEESRRLALLRSEPNRHSARYFLFRDVHRRLRECASPP